MGVALDLKNDLLFIGNGATAVAWYRCFLPAMTLGCDHVGFWGDPPKAEYATGIVRGKSQRPNLLDYKVVIIQQPRGKGWMKVIDQLQSKGIRVIFEVDDWLHAIKSQKDHDFRDHFDKKALAEYEACMKKCDAMIVSTEFLARQYRGRNKTIFVCENGVDVNRYDLKMPVRTSVNIGWAGATGHRDATAPWLQAVARVMAKNDNVCFVSIGQPFADAFRKHFPRERAIAVPFAAMEQYPAAMTLMDIALGPAAPTGFYRGKSDLRWLEAGALGIPIIAHPLVYPRITHLHDGVHAEDPLQVEGWLTDLVHDHVLRSYIGSNARRYVHEHRSSAVTGQRWAEVVQELWSRWTSLQ